jgi:hypothetical protein
VLPDWFDFEALRTFVAVATVVAALGAILSVAFFRRTWLRAGFAVVLLGAAATLVFYFQGPLNDCKETCSCRFLKTDIAVDGCATVPVDSAHGANA